MKPKMQLNPEKDVNALSMITRAACILNAHGLKEQAKAIHQEAKANGYDDFLVFGLLKKYMDI